MQRTFEHTFLTKRRLAFSSLFIVLLFSCNPTRKLKENEYLLNRNVIIDRSASLFKLNPDLEKSDFESYIKQKPNRKVLLLRFHLFLYNLIDKDKALRKKQKRDERYDKKNKEHLFKFQQENEKRAKKGLPPRTPHLKDKDRLTWREWVMDIGEPPVIYDSLMRRKSTQQIQQFLHNKGYFNCTVRDSASLKDKRANVFYIITPNKPYKINEVKFTVKDQVMSYYVHADTMNSLLIKGKNYDSDVFQAERERITKNLRNEGYYYFSKDYIYYKVDSSLHSNQVNVELIIRKRSIKPEGGDTLVEADHTRYYLNHIYIITDFNPKIKKSYTDTIRDKDSSYYFLGSTLKYKTKVLTDAIFLRPGDLYQSTNSDLSYKRLSEMRAFKFINIKFEDNGSDYLDCFVQLSPIPKQTFTVETEGTNTGGNLGVNGSFVYQNRNVFKGAEIFEFRIRGGLEVQKILTESTDENNIINESPIPFNTIEIGPEASIIVPRFLLPFRVVTSRNSNPKTVFKTSYNYQKRSDYTRGALQLSYGFNWNESKTKKHFIYPVEVNLVNFTGTPKFEALLTDPLQKDRYSDHFTTDTRYAFIFSNQNLNKKKDFSYFKFGAEASGNTLRGVYNLLDQYVTPMPSVDESYTINGTKFSQYLRSDIDWRHYFVFSETNRLVFRLAAGIGKPLNNLRELPLEKSFFAGGPNGIRAWKARTLGPGSFYDTLQTSFDKIGDNQIETNLEYRFNVVRVLNAAAFIDAGNIWLRKPDPKRPGGEAKYNLELLDEFAIGAGLGVRLDFSFFIIRLDAAVPIKDPALPKGDRWTFDKQPLMRTNLNFGIGYPF